MENMNDVPALDEFGTDLSKPMTAVDFANILKPLFEQRRLIIDTNAQATFAACVAMAGQEGVLREFARVLHRMARRPSDTRKGDIVRLYADGVPGGFSFGFGWHEITGVIGDYVQTYNDRAWCHGGLIYRGPMTRPEYYKTHEWSVHT